MYQKIVTFRLITFK